MLANLFDKNTGRRGRWTVRRWLAGQSYTGGKAAFLASKAHILGVDFTGPHVLVIK